MGGLPYDLLANPLGAVRLTFEKAAAGEGFDPAAFGRKDWGAVELFRNFLFEENGIHQVPILNSENLQQQIQPNSLVRFRGMVQDMFDNELYVGAFKDGESWRTNKFVDVPIVPMSPAAQTHLWERRLLFCVPIPGQNSWTLESTSSPQPRNTLSESTSKAHHGEKRRRNDVMDCDVNEHEPELLNSTTKKQKEDEPSFQPSLPRSSEVQGSQSKTSTLNYFDANPLSCLVKVYDIPDSDFKLNDVIEFIGVYTFDPELAVHKDDNDDLSFDLMENVLDHFPPSKVPRLHCIAHKKLSLQDFVLGPPVSEPSSNLIRDVRCSLLGYLTSVLGNDGLAAQCVLLHLISSVRARVDTIAVGRLSVNLTGLSRESASIFGSSLMTSFRSILAFSQAMSLTIDYLNTAVLRPRKDNQTGRLVSGVLQLAQGTHLMIDETSLNSGTLNSTGIENARLLKYLMEWHMVEYDFEYYKLDMPADIQLLIFSKGKSDILPADLILPFWPTTVSIKRNISSEELQAWRWYLATLRTLPHSIEPESQKMLEEDLVEARKEDGTLRGEDFSRWLTMAQLMSSSFGETRLSLEHWQMVRELERLRKERLR